MNAPIGRYGNLEESVTNVAIMASICGALVERFATNTAAMRRMELTGRQVLDQMQDEEDQIVFAVFQLGVMTSQLRAKYFDTGETLGAKL